MNIGAIEKETGAKLSYNVESGKAEIEGTEEATDRAIALLREDAAEATKQLRERQGLSAAKTVKREIQLDWSRDAEVMKQRRFMAAHGSYHQWGEDQLSKLSDFLKPGDEVIPMYAFSLYIKRGPHMIHYRKDGEILAV